MITPRRTRLVRVRDLHAFRDAIVAAARSSHPDCVVVVPNAGARHQLGALLARRLDASTRPDLVTRDELYDRLHARLAEPPRRLTAYERDVIAAAAARDASDDPRYVRPGFVSELLRFYDQLRRQRQQVARFEELLEDALQRDAEFDRGAERMLEQTHFLAAAFRGYERRLADAGAVDEHSLRDRLMAGPSPSPVRAAVVTVADWIADPGGLNVADFDLLSRVPGLETIDVVATEGTLASGFHQRLHDWMPGLEEADFDGPPSGRPRLSVPDEADERTWFTVRDREEELVRVARRLKADGSTGSDRAAVVYKRPLPYLYLAREVFRSAGVSYQTSDTLPLAAEPFAAAVDLIFEFVSSAFTRDAMIALLRSPHFVFGDPPVGRRAVAALDRALSEVRYLGDFERLSRLPAGWPTRERHREALPALQAAVAAAAALAPLRTPAPASVQIDLLMSFLDAHGATAEADPASRAARGRAAVLSTLRSVAAASHAHDDALVDVDALRAITRRWIEEQTFASERPEPAQGLQLVDEQAARYGDFDEMTMVGLIDGEWPERPQPNIFYTPSLLSALGWPSEKDWRSAAAARFVDLVSSASQRVALSTITLDDEALVQRSALLDEVARARLSTEAREPAPSGRVFAEEALSLDPPALEAFAGEPREWAEMRAGRSASADPAFHGQAGVQAPRAWSVSAIETYLDCPFKFFAQHVLKLEEEPEDEEVMDPRRQGQFVHAVFERFFAVWQDAGRQAIGPANLDEARAVFERVVDDSLAGLGEAEAGLERTRLLGSSAAAGLGEAVLRMEAERPVGVVARLLEHRLEGDFVFETPAGRRTVALKGKADRVDLLEDGTFRLIDYKLGWPPNGARALQLAIYSLCAEQRLRGHLGRTWALGEAAYLAFKGPKRVVPLFRPGDRDRVLSQAQERLAGAVDGIARGDFPPRPDDVYRCETCTFSAVCRTDYVDDDV